MIFSSRAKNMGTKNIVIAILAIFSSLPFLVIFHVFGILFFIMPMSYLLSCNKYKIFDFIGFDRYKLPQLSLIDRLNCLYCSYANGLATYYQFKIRELFSFSGKVNLLTKIIMITLYPLFYLSTQIYRIHSTFTYNTVVFPIISYRPPSMKGVIKKEIKNRHFIKAKNALIGRLLRKERIFSIVLSNGLSAIETFWCPLKNYRNDAIIYPNHHSLFYDLEDKNDVVKLLRNFR